MGTTAHPNGKPGVLAIEWGRAVKLSFVGLVATMLGQGLFAWRTVSVNSARLDTLEKLYAEQSRAFQAHLDWSRDELPKLVTMDEFNRAMDERAAHQTRIENRLDAMATGQAHSLRLLEMLPKPIEPSH